MRGLKGGANLAISCRNRRPRINFIGEARVRSTAAGPSSIDTGGQRGRLPADIACASFSRPRANVSHRSINRGRPARPVRCAGVIQRLLRREIFDARRVAAAARARRRLDWRRYRKNILAGGPPRTRRSAA